MQTSVTIKIKPRHLAATLTFVIVGLYLIAGYLIVTYLSPFLVPASQPQTGNSNTLVAPVMPSGAPIAQNMGMPTGIPISSLQAPPVAPHVKTFTLTAESARIKLNSGTTINAWTFNGTAPGPTLRVKQGDLVIVHLINHLTFGVTIHWHGINVPNSADGVAGVTQDAVKPGQTYTYRFIAKDPGTYWYHSHQFSYAETTGGLYGTIIVDPATPLYHDDVDYTVSLHDWQVGSQDIYTLNASTGALNYAARPGQWVRLRLVNTASSEHMLTLVGAPFMVAALDGHDLNGPQMLTTTPIVIGAAQRYDLRFQMPAHGAVSLVNSLDLKTYQADPAVLIGQGSIPSVLPVVTKWFDMTTYGTPRPDPITPHSHFDASYTIDLSNHMGDSMGRMGMVYTLNGKSFPNTGMIMLKEGQLVRIRLVNQSNFIHPIHIHGHTFAVILHNGKPLTGSPVYLDTVNIQPHDTYDIAFFANNPGIWMLHCHDLLHANWGMDMMIMYDIKTPYTVGSQSGNFPD